MSALPKPAARAPKAPRPIARRARLARSSNPIARKTRISKRTKASRRKAVLYADSLASQICRRRSETCVSPRLAEWREGVYVPCGKPVSQAAHGYDRADIGTRWDLRNLFPSCYSCNCLVYQRRKRAWFEWVEAQWGPELTAEMRMLARRPAKSVDLRAVTAVLEAVLHMGAPDPGAKEADRG